MEMILLACQMLAGATRAEQVKRWGGEWIQMPKRRWFGKKVYRWKAVA